MTHLQSSIFLLRATGGAETSLSLAPPSPPDRYARRAYNANFAPLTNVISHAQSMLDSTSGRCSSEASRASEKLRDRNQRSETVNTASSDSSLATTSQPSCDAFITKPENCRPIH